MINQIVKKAGVFFGLGTVLSIERASEGLGNENYFVRTNDGKKYVMKLLRSQTIEGLENEMSILEQLKKTDIITAKFVVGKNRKIYFECGKHTVTCTEFINGDLRLKISDELSMELGKTLASFHTGVKYLPAKTDFWLSKENALKETKKLPTTLLGKKIKKRIESTIYIFELNLPKGIIHGDLHLSNLVVTPNNKIAIFDFEDVDENILLLDIAITSVSLLSKRNEKSVVKNLLAGYESVRPLRELEQQSLPLAIRYVTGASAAWLLNEGHPHLAEEMILFNYKINETYHYEECIQ